MRAPNSKKRVTNKFSESFDIEVSQSDLQLARSLPLNTDKAAQLSHNKGTSNDSKQGKAN